MSRPKDFRAIMTEAGIWQVLYDGALVPRLSAPKGRRPIKLAGRGFLYELKIIIS